MTTSSPISVADVLERRLQAITWPVQGQSAAPSNLYDWLMADNRYPQHRGRSAALRLILELHSAPEGELVEHVARAICAAVLPDRDPDEVGRPVGVRGSGTPLWKCYEAHAHAAIQAAAKARCGGSEARSGNGPAAATHVGEDAGQRDCAECGQPYPEHRKALAGGILWCPGEAIRPYRPSAHQAQGGEGRG